MPVNQYLPFGTAVGANVLTQPEWQALSDRLSGMGAGLVPSVKVNKALRQTTSMVAALAELIMDRTGGDVLDDGDITGLRDQLLATMLAIATGAGTGGVTIDALQLQVDQLLAGKVLFENSAATSRTFALVDAGRKIRRTAGSAMTDTIPTNAAVAFEIGTTITLRRVGAGTLTIVAAGGVTLNVPGGAIAAARAVHSDLMIHKVNTDEWDLTGDLGAA